MEMIMVAARPFTGLMVSTEIGMLRSLHGMLENDPVDSREQFIDLMKAAVDHCKLEPKEIADDLGFSLSTVYRWVEGRTAPHPSLYPTIVKWIMAAIERKVAAYQAAS